LVISAVTNFEVKISVCSQSSNNSINSNNSYIFIPAVFIEEVSSLITHIICNKQHTLNNEALLQLQKSRHL